MFKIDFAEAEKLQQVMKDYQGNTEDAINDVLHNYAGDRAQVDIYALMPVSDPAKVWAGKAPHAKLSKSLRNVFGNLSVTVTTSGDYSYLYFPDDGTNTRRHAGNQQFFARGGDAATNDSVERCVIRLTNEFEKGV